MALSPMQKEKLRDLELEKGGVAFVSEKSAVTPIPTIVISLGGLGAKTLNTLKGKFVREIGESDHVYFRALDTSQKDCDALCKIKGDGTPNYAPNANLEQSECIQLYTPAIADILKEANIPPNIKKWINKSLIGTPLDNTGAQQIRQIGRAMFTNDTVYQNVRAKLNSVILDAINKRMLNGSVDVIILAGVSGGTGSGTIVDVAYMIHDIFKSAGCHDYKLAGYVYTPDAQFRVPAIATSPAIQQNLKKNGYAALKEIDYFMNIEETNSVYKLQLGSREVISSKNIFSSCTLISGYAAGGGLNETNKTIGRLTDQLMDMLTDIQIIQDGQPVQMSSSIMSNENAMLTAWLGEHTARRIYHRYASYKYQVLGYSSIVVPRDEILAYCVNKIYEKVLDEFQNFKLVNKEMMAKIYQLTNIINPDAFTTYAVTANSNNPINRSLILDNGYTKRIIQQNPMVAYEDACEQAKSERLKINPGFVAILEDKLYTALKNQVDQIFEQYGPYVALKAIEHKHTELSVGNPNEPFPGIVEQLQIMSNKFLDRANRAAKAFQEHGAEMINQEAAAATSGLFSNQAAIGQYVQVCCEQAVTSQIDSLLFRAISDVLNNVAKKMNDLNNEMFDVYTSILTEVQNLLNKDGQYFATSETTTDGRNTSFSVDIIKSGKAKADQLEKYLNSFISKVAVGDLAANFIKKMKDNKDKWLAMNNDNDFDVVGEVRTLMDECLTNNQMKTDIIEKFVTVAYSPIELTPEQLDEIWDDDTPNSPKTIALTTAANEIYNQLMSDAQPMANSSGRIPLDAYTPQYFISTLSDTPKLTAILNAKVRAMQGFTPAISNSNNKFIITQQYMSIPMYILLGMSDYNKTYIDNPTAGRHMDENVQNWGRFPNPYTIDSVANDLLDKGEPSQYIESYEDYKILLDVKKKTLDGLNKYQFVEIYKADGGLVKMVLHDVTNQPANMEAFKEDLKNALYKNSKLDIIAFMKENGFVINPVEVKTGQTDIDLALTDLNNANWEDKEGKYKDIPVPVEDVFKWLRKSIKYMDILDKCTVLFEEIQKVKDQVDQEKLGKRKYINDVEIFAFALRTGLVRQNANNDKIWNYMNGQEPVSVNFGRFKSFDKKYYLYHLFVSFDSLEDARLKAIKAQADKMIDDGKEVSVEALVSHVEEVLSDKYLGDIFNAEVINEQAEDQGVTENYQLTDKPEDQGNPYKVLKRFYELLATSLE